ncbi:MULTISPECIES: hypothetical protein [Cycloclasticus]|uniref:DUF2802 domain-containing protein n=1 Tax=Cycloclasticus pugetii TaxID=34068 RepID=A0AB33YZX0_9GAMM|nr:MULTISPECIES: hypothetical protein [Cycloclasticus]ATI02386.1 hypothetical protein CPC19_02570 [Cycloclasticus sp. PY97N]EPD12475.1 hypothetical protein L196_10154 [Cycloclasticus pugetii]
MSESFLILLIELVFVLTAIVGLLLFKAYKKKEALQSQITGLVKKVDKEAQGRKETLENTFKAQGIAADQAGQNADRLVGAEANCVKKFAVAQLSLDPKDIASFSEAVYGLSAEHLDVGLLNAEILSSTQVPVAPVVQPVQPVQTTVGSEQESVQVNDDIEVSLDLDALADSDSADDAGEQSESDVKSVNTATPTIEPEAEEELEIGQLDGHVEVLRSPDTTEDSDEPVEEEAELKKD